MGGKNHQPCRQYLVISTEMSRALSLAHISLESANVALEDLLLTELNGGKGVTDLIIGNLLSSKKFLGDFGGYIAALIVKMNEENYADLPPLHKLDISTLGIELSRAGLVQAAAWAKVSGIMKAGTFYAVLSTFEVDRVSLISATDDLIKKVEFLAEHAKNGTVNSVLEENFEGNIKVEFAVLYQRWNTFQNEFLASAMLSTQLWYAHTGAGWLVEPSKFIRAA